MRWGIGVLLLAAALVPAWPGGGAAAEEPVYEEAPPGPIYSPVDSVGSKGIRFNGLRLNRRNGSAVLYVRVPGPGRAILDGRGVRRLVRGAPRAMVVRLPVKPKVRLRRYLERHGKGRIRVEVTFKPTAGEPRTLEKPIVLRRKRR